MTNKQSDDEQQEWLSGITVFLIRECELAYLDTLLKLLDHYGFNVLCSVPIESGQQQALAQWVLDDGQEQGNFASSGSPPVFLLVVQDVHPVPVKRMSSDSPNLRLPTIRQPSVPRSLQRRAKQNNRVRYIAPAMRIRRLSISKPWCPSRSVRYVKQP